MGGIALGLHAQHQMWCAGHPAFWGFYIVDLNVSDRSYIEDLAPIAINRPMVKVAMLELSPASSWRTASWTWGSSRRDPGSPNDGDPTRHQLRDDRLHEIANWTALLEIMCRVDRARHPSYQFFLLTRFAELAVRGIGA